MNIRQLPITMLPLSALVCNEGQIADVPANPRLIKDDKYKALVKSLQEDDLTGVEPLKVYPMGEQFVVLGGNMRFRALQELKVQDVACIIVPKSTPAKVLRKVVILDNSGFGEYDWDLLANEWEAEELKEWGVDVPTEQLPEEQPDLSDSINVEYKVEVTCTCEEEQERLYNDLTSQGYSCRLLTL